MICIFPKSYTIQEQVFIISVFLSYCLYIIVSLGIYYLNPIYLNILNEFIRIYVCFFLIIRFNPFKKEIILTSLDKRIAFSAGVILFTTNFLSKLLNGNFFDFN